MRLRGLLAALALAALVPAMPAPAGAVVSSNQEQYCAGFEEGYRMKAGDYVYLPYCPAAPFISYGTTYYREGLKRGMAQACIDHPAKC